MITLIKSKAQEEACKHTFMDIIGFDIHIHEEEYLTVYLTTYDPIERVCEDIIKYIEAINIVLLINNIEYTYLKGIHYVNKFI